MRFVTHGVTVDYFDAVELSEFKVHQNASIVLLDSQFSYVFSEGWCIAVTDVVTSSEKYMENAVPMLSMTLPILFSFVLLLVALICLAHRPQINRISIGNQCEKSNN